MLFFYHTEESSNLGVILGSVLGVTIIGATAIIIAVSAISCLIKKGTIIIMIIVIIVK